MENYKTQTMTFKNLIQIVLGKAALAVVLPLLFLSAAVPAAAQTAMIGKVGVYYKNNAANTNMDELYCNWPVKDLSGIGADLSYEKSFVGTLGNSSDPWKNSALIEYDQPYPSTAVANDYPNHCLGLCMDVYCVNPPTAASTYSIAFPIQDLRFDIVKYYEGKNIYNKDETPSIRSINLYPMTSGVGLEELRLQWQQYDNEKTASNAAYQAQLAIINNADTVPQQAYNNYNTFGCVNAGTAVQDALNRLTACHNITPTQDCSSQQAAYDNAVAAANNCNTWWNTNGGKTYAAALSSKACLNTVCTAASAVPELPCTNCPTIMPCNQWSPNTSTKTCFADGITFYPVRTAEQRASNFLASLDKGTTNYMCAAYACDGASSDKAYTCATAQYACVGRDANSVCTNIATRETKRYNEVCSVPSTVGAVNCMIQSGFGAAFNEPIRYCAAWDGSYEIAGEFGKTNGDFAYRANIHTNYPGDNVVVDKIEVEDTKAYPGMNQIPIQVDVTDVHTVRSTPTVVGSITSVAAQPYTLAYRLSKDSNVRIGIYDASTTTPNAGFDAEELEPNGQVKTWNALRRVLADWLPKTGEGIKGQTSDKLIIEFDSWDGRDKDGRLLPAGNYIAAIQAKANDEWPGTDYSRAVTRQISLDPLKLTDIVASGLTKQATAYSTIKYVPTEAATIHWNIYTPGTTFATDANGAMYTKSYEPTGTAPTITTNTGTLVYSAAEERSARMNYTSRWDGLCGVSTGCVRTYSRGEKQSDGTICAASTCQQTFAYGAPLPDGNYVYVLWAEIPYNTVYHNATSCDGGNCGYANPQTACAALDNGCYTAVKTLRYETGQLAVERGLVDITIQPVSYSTVGSSPTAYGLEPFLFKYSIARDSTVIARVENSAGLLVKSLTQADGISNVAEQLNTLQWDGRDDQGRMVSPGTYMFTVQAKDAMFPAVVNKASAIFPVDMYRLVDLATTDVYGDSEAKATISYYLSKAMNVQVSIYNKDVVIPNYNTTTGEYTTGLIVTTPGTPVITHAATGTEGTKITYTPTATPNEYTRVTVVTAKNPDPAATQANAYQITTTTDTVQVAVSALAIWPPRICNTHDDAVVFTAGYVDPAKIAVQGQAHACLYVNDTAFTHYPANAAQASNVKELDVRLQPVKTFDRSSTRPGEGLKITEEWDALYFYNPASTQCQGQTDINQCKYEMVPDGQYPFYISARSNEAVNRYYAAGVETGKPSGNDYIPSAPYTDVRDIVQSNFLYATEKPVSRINVTRGPVYFLEGTTTVYPNAPQLFNASSGPIFIPPYEINFAVSRASTVEVAIVALGANVCNPVGSITGNNKNNKTGDVCKYLSTTTIINTGSFDPTVARKVYWDGTDNNGYYVKPGIYEVRLIAKNYPDPGLYQETIKSITINADLMKVFDLLEADGYSQSVRGTDVKIGYQISVPMKVAIQIFKPGTTIFDYQKGTLRDPSTGKEVQDINDVLVRSIVGIRPATTLIEEVWDGRDYAQQEVPDGTYPFRFVTAINSADVNTITGAIEGANDASADQAVWAMNKVADTYQYQNLHKITIAVGDGRFVCEDWEKTVFFYPNPFRGSNGTLEITKMPVPGTMSLKFYTLDGTMVRNGGYTCVDANNYQTVMGETLTFNPDNNISDNPTGDSFPTVRNAALRCRWDRNNQHGKKVARGVYFGLVDFKAQNGREHCQKVVKVLIP